MSGLDSTIPQGDPNSGTCRHCGQSRMVLRGARLCRSRDAPSHLVSPEKAADS